MLDFIIKLVTIIFTEFIHILCYQKLTGKLYKVNIKNILCLISLSVVAELNNMYTPIGLKALVTFFIMAVIMFFWFRLSWKENLKIGQQYQKARSPKKMRFQKFAPHLNL